MATQHHNQETEALRGLLKRYRHLAHLLETSHATQEQTPSANQELGFFAAWPLIPQDLSPATSPPGSLRERLAQLVRHQFIELAAPVGLAHVRVVQAYFHNRAHHPTIHDAALLTHFLQTSAEELTERLTEEWPNWPLSEECDGAYCSDLSLAAHLETIGEMGQDLASRIREASRERVSVSLHEGEEWLLRGFALLERDSQGVPQTLHMRAVECLCEALWFDQVQAEAEQWRSREAQAPVVSTSWANWFLDIATSDAQIIDTPTGQQHLLGRSGSRAAWFPDRLADATLQPQALGSVYLPRIIFELVLPEMHERFVHSITQSDGKIHPDIIIEGGWRELCRRLNLPYCGQTVAQLRNAFAMGATVRVDWGSSIKPSYQLGLWLLSDVAAAPGRPARLILTSAPILRPDMWRLLGLDKPSRLMVPIPDMTHLAYYGDRRGHSTQYAARLALCRHLASNPTTYLSQGAPIEDTQSLELALRPLSRELDLSRLRQAWCEPTEDARPFVIQRDGVWHLADPRAHHLLETSAEARSHWRNRRRNRHR